MAFPKLRAHPLKLQSEPPECHRAILELHRAGRLNYFAAASYDLERSATVSRPSRHSERHGVSDGMADEA